MHVAISGSTGLIGEALVRGLEGAGHQVTRLVRSSPGRGRALWDPQGASIDRAALQGIDTCVHLAGKSIGALRWTTGHKAQLLDSRVRGTRLLAETLASLEPRPKVFVSGSAVGYYGNRGDQVLSEEAGVGGGFLADVVAQWEASTRPAVEAGIRTVITRSGIVLARQGGALPKMLIPFRLGLGAKFGSGEQFFPWISIDDEVRGLMHCLENDSLEGPVNLTGPEPVSNEVFTKTLGRVLRRPALLFIPAVAVKLGLGQMGEEMLLYSQRVVPEKLERAGFKFRHKTVEQALRAVLAKP